MTALGLVVCSYVLIEVCSKLEDLVTESLSYGSRIGDLFLCAS